MARLLGKKKIWACSENMLFLEHQRIVDFVDLKITE